MGTLTIRGSTSGNVSLTVPSTIPSNVSFTLPSADGTTGQMMITDGAGNLSFTTAVSQANVTAASIYANGAFSAANAAASDAANAAVIVSGTTPIGQSGSLWFDTANLTLHVYHAGFWYQV